MGLKERGDIQRLLRTQIDSSDFIDAIMEGKSHLGTPHYKRFFVEDNDLFHLNGVTYAVSNQWGATFKSTMNALLDKLNIEEVFVDAAD
jgi:hypothetical protein